MASAHPVKSSKPWNKKSDHHSWWKATAGELTVAATIISHGGPSSDAKNGLTVNGGQGRVWARIVSLPDIAALGRIPVGGRALVASELGGGRFASGELEEIARVGWMVEMAVEPPLVKSVIGQRSHGPIVVRIGLGGDVETIHARMVDCCEDDEYPTDEEDEDGLLTDMGVHVNNSEGEERKKRESEHVGNQPEKHF